MKEEIMCNIEQKKLNEFVGYLCNHLVVLDTEEKINGKIIESNGYPNKYICSGIVVELFGKYFILTAGHCVEAFKDMIKEENKNENYKFKTNLVDCLGSDSKTKYPIPFTEWIRTNYKWAIDKPGIDIGLIELNNNNLELLKASKIKILNLVTAAKYSNNYDKYMLLGQPKNLVKRNNFYTLGINVLKLPDLSEDSVFEKFTGAFYNCADLEVMGNDIRGVSGGPILGINLNIDIGQPIYYIFAIQSSWRKSEYIIFGSLLSEFVKLLLAASSRIIENTFSTPPKSEIEKNVIKHNEECKQNFSERHTSNIYLVMDLVLHLLNLEDKIVFK